MAAHNRRMSDRQRYRLSDHLSILAMLTTVVLLSIAVAVTVVQALRVLL